VKIYIAGPMRGIPEFNFPAFRDMAFWLRNQGHIVFNPAERDEATHGAGFEKGNLLGSEQEAASNHGFSLREALADDMKWIALQAGVEQGVMHPAIAQMHEDMIQVIKKAVLGGARPSDILMTIVVQGEAFNDALKMQGAR
jgi:hypothetical protein